MDAPLFQNTPGTRQLRLFPSHSIGKADPLPYHVLTMKCPCCGFAQDRVVDSRESKEADSIRRRRECEKCGRRFTTYERIDKIPYIAVKREPGIRPHAH